MVRLDRLGRLLSELLTTVTMLKQQGIARLGFEEKIDTSSAAGDGSDHMSGWFPRGRQLATVLALLLLVFRLAVPGPVPSAGSKEQEAEIAGLLGDVPICHAGLDPASAPSQPGGQPAVPVHDCALCPICQAAAPALLALATWIPRPTQVGTARIELPSQSTGPPLPERYAAPPRGPPASVV